MLLTKNSDTFGAMASGLCLVHCIATPFIFVATCTKTCCASSPWWWSAIDYIFIGVSLIAVYWSARNTSKKWVKYAMYSAWAILSLVVLNEKFGIFHLSELIIYIPALVLIALHLYNRKYCQCADDSCCANL